MAKIDRWRWPARTESPEFRAHRRSSHFTRRGFCAARPFFDRSGWRCPCAATSLPASRRRWRSASHGLSLFAPVPRSRLRPIFGRRWVVVALFGLRRTLVGHRSARYSPDGRHRFETAEELLRRPHAASSSDGGSSVALLLAADILLLILIEQSLGDISSEPLGGAPARRARLGIGRRFCFFLSCRRHDPRSSTASPRPPCPIPAATRRVFRYVASVLPSGVFAAGACGGSARSTSMAEMLGERVLAWHLGAFGVLIPFSPRPSSRPCKVPSTSPPSPGYRAAAPLGDRIGGRQWNGACRSRNRGRRHSRLARE